MIDSNVAKLDYYLENNNCEKQLDFMGCYRETRLLLILTTKELDASNDHVNNLNRVVDRMAGNVSSIIDNLTEVTTESTTDSKVASVKKLIK
jgi:hypothetical protein